MDWLNYHHLFYFWTVAKSGTVSAAAEQLHLARPTVTSQVRELEKSVGQKLFLQQGRGLVLTEFGQKIFEYAEDIFSIGNELRDFVKTGQPDRRQKFRVGMPDVVPKLIAFELLKPALVGPEAPRMECYEGKLNDLLVDLAMHRLDLVLSDSPAPGTLDVNVYSHKLGECGLSILATPALAKKFRKGFPNSITNAPILLPTKLTAVRRSLDRWMEDRKVFPEIVAEFEDSALLKVFGQAGQGVFPVPTAIEDLVKKQYGAWLVGRIPEVLDTFYVISVEKRVQHHAAIRIKRQARNKLFES